MLGGIEAEPVDGHLFGQPAPPELEFLVNRAIAEFDVGAHQEVEVAEFLVDFLVPFAFAIIVDDAEYAVFLRVLEPIDPAEALVIPFELRMLAAAAGEGEAGVDVGVEGLVLDLGAIVRIDAVNRHALGVVGPHLVVEDHVVNDPQSGLAKRSAGALETGTVAVLGRDGALLVEFAEVEEVIGVVAD